jgi:dTDP-4-dehydrorhamnose reductase
VNHLAATTTSPGIPAHYRRVLVTGAAGQLGRAFARALVNKGEADGSAPQITWTDLQADPARNISPCNLADTAQLSRLLEAVKPDLILNPGAYTAVDKAESEPDLAHAVNATAVDIMAQWARAHDATMIHYSTDYVFDGSGTKPWRETDPTVPVSTYGRTKLEGEKAMLTSGVRGAIFRTSWVYSDEGHNFIKTMLRLGAERDELRVVADQIGVPTSAHFLARMTLIALNRAHQNPRDIGPAAIYHLVPCGELSWHQFAEYILARARAAGHPVKAQRVVPITTAEYPTPARRPLNSRLDFGKFARQFNAEIPDWRDGVDHVIELLCGPASKVP